MKRENDLVRELEQINKNLENIAIVLDNFLNYLRVTK